MKFTKKLTVITLAICALALTLGILPIHGESELYSNVLRLHVLANSDSEADQELTYRLRDYLLEDFTHIFDGCADAEEARTAAKASTAEIAEKARIFLDSQGCSMPVSVSVENIFFTTRTYGTVVVPAGNYDALRVVIGEGEGKNWWCVMFPPLCLPAASETADAEYGKAAEQLLFDSCISTYSKIS